MWRTYNGAAESKAQLRIYCRKEAKSLHLKPATVNSCTIIEIMHFSLKMNQLSKLLSDIFLLIARLFIALKGAEEKEL